MADAYVQLDQQSLTVVGTEVDITGTGTADGTIVKHIRVVNTDATESTAIRIWQSAGAPLNDDTKLIMPTADIAAGGWAEFEGTIILDSGESLWASLENSTDATAHDITVTTYGLNMTP